MERPRPKPRSLARDNHYRVEGPVVGQLQAAFEDNWVKTTGNVLVGEEYFPLPAERRKMLGRRSSKAHRKAAEKACNS